MPVFMAHNAMSAPLAPDVAARSLLVEVDDQFHIVHYWVPPTPPSVGNSPMQALESVADATLRNALAQARHFGLPVAVEAMPAPGDCPDRPMLLAVEFLGQPALSDYAMFRIVVDAPQTSEIEHLAERGLYRAEQAYPLNADAAALEESIRWSLAEELHDTLGQLLSLIAIKVTAHSTRERRGSLQVLLQDLSHLVEQASRAVRFQLTQLVPDEGTETDLAAAINALAEDMRRTYGLSTNIRVEANPQLLDPPIVKLLRRCIRELLCNVCKHSHSLFAEIVLSAQQHSIKIQVIDQGRGFDLHALEGHVGFGLLSIRERLGCIGGTIHIDSTQGKGTAITLSLPLATKTP